MLLGQRTIAKGDVRNYKAHYREFLIDGARLATQTVTSSSTTSTITNTSINVYDKTVLFTVNAGQVNESFTVTIHVTTTLGEAVTDTVNFTVA